MAEQPRESNGLKFDAVVVLGAGVSDICAGRVKAGLDLVKKGFAKVLVFVGGSTEEEFFVKSLAQSLDVEVSKIYVDVNSKNTVDNALYAKAILRTLGARKIALVTSAYHMPRALAIFEWVLGDEYQISPFEVQDNPGECELYRETLLRTLVPLMKALIAKGDEKGIKKVADLLDPDLLDSIIKQLGVAYEVR